jgi:hypothetical protein
MDCAGADEPADTRTAVTARRNNVKSDAGHSVITSHRAALTPGSEGV